MRKWLGTALEKGRDANRRMESSMKYTSREIEGSIQALNIFFGAVIGISLAGIEDIPTWEYTLILVVTAAVVMTILLVSNTHRRVSQTASMVVMLVVTYFVFHSPSVENDLQLFVPEKLFPTLVVWAAMAVSTEFMPRYSEEEAKGD